MNVLPTSNHAVDQSQSEIIALQVFSEQPKADSDARRSTFESEPAILDQSGLNRIPTNVAEQEDIPPNGGYGWVCAVCVFMINAHTWGVNSAWAIFLAQYLAKSTFPGATHLEYALIGGLSISSALITSPLITLSVRRLGTRFTLLFGTLVVFTSLITASYASQIWHLFLSQGLCFGFGMGFLYIPATAALPQWFSTRRSLAVGIASSGAGLGGLAYNLIAGRAVEAVGLSWTYRILAFCTLGVNLICAILLKDRNKQVKPQQAAFNFREYQRIEVLLVIFWGFLAEIGYIVLLYSLPAYANSIGLTHTQGSVLGAVLNLGLGISRPVVGYYSDTLGRINVATIMTASCGFVCLAIWVPARSFAVLVAFALFAGTGCGTFWGTTVSVTAEVVGLKRLPSVFGMICLSLVLPTTFAEPIALEVVASSGGHYLASQIMVGILFLLSATSAWCLRAWKIAEIENKARLERHNVGLDAAARNSSGVHDFWLTPRRLFMLRRV